jgi:hypothetical protein
MPRNKARTKRTIAAGRLTGGFIFARPQDNFAKPRRLGAVHGRRFFTLEFILLSYPDGLDIFKDASKGVRKDKKALELHGSGIASSTNMTGMSCRIG